MALGRSTLLTSYRSTQRTQTAVKQPSAESDPAGGRAALTCSCQLLVGILCRLTAVVALGCIQALTRVWTVLAERAAAQGCVA